MQVGLGLPISDPELLLDWAWRADAGPFSALGLLDRLAYDNHEAAGVPVTGRGRRMDEQLAVLGRAWTGAIGPAPLRHGRPEILFGGFRPAALVRIARWGDGFLAAAPPQWAGGLFRAVEDGWRAAGRPGRPRIVAQVNAVLGPQAVVDDARAALDDYYAYTGETDHFQAGLLTTSAAISDTISRFGDLGADEVMLYCWARDPDQVDRLAELTSTSQPSDGG
jgi:alkanesulfonate monooxygenase SsuD/methylene tetrahydromethanopterin reductase-like flavin-dependent oxidoreductase (luciferase family)